MARPELPREFAPRLLSYGLDERARQHLRETWPLIEPQLDAVLDELITGTSRLPHVAAIYAKHSKFVRSKSSTFARC
jgi:hypothetical protein